MDDELREKIAIALLNTDDSKKDETYREHKLRQADSILSLPSPVIEKAEKWKKVEEIAKRNWYGGYPCDGCPVENCCDSADSLCGQADALVQALTGKEPR